MIKLDKTLYKLHSNNQIGSWRIFVSDGEAFPIMVREACKVISGTPVVTVTEFLEGKNIGRSNETTPLEQAIAEAESKIRKQYDKGYVDEIPSVGDTVTNGLGFLKPMLAQPIDKVRDWSYPVYVQPKFDGHRMLATVNHKDEVVLYSRQGKIIDVEHIRYSLQELYDNGHWCGTTLDGEIYLHGESLQRISSLVKKPKPESKELVYNLYDIMHTDSPYDERLSDIRQISENAICGKINVTETWFIDPDNGADDELIEFHATFLGRGYEGTIVRHGDTGYEDGKRSKSLMKKKDFQDAEFRIVSHELGKPDIKADGTYERPVFICEAHNGERFGVTAPGTMQERHQFFLNGLGNYIGRLLTVKFFNLTPDGIPFHPVALRVREDI